MHTLNMVVDQRFKRTPDGRVWTHVPPAYEFFEGALCVFDRVRIIARTIDIDRVPENARVVNGINVEVVAVPSFVGPIQYLRQRSRVSEALARVADLDGAFLLRIPSQTAFVLASRLTHLGRPYAVELLTDPYEFFAPGVSPNGLASLFRPYFCARSRDLCANAVAVNYITGSATRRVNPATRAKCDVSVSDVDLSEDSFLNLPRPAATSVPIEIVSVGFFDLLYKGQDLLIKALADCAGQGLNFRLTFVGDGRSRETLTNLAASYGIGHRIRITGALGGANEVRKYLGAAHLFTLPSRAEGIPRALLEAMAAGLPAICSNVGAMPDLLDPRWIVQPGSVHQLRAKFLEFLQVPGEWAAIGRRNQDVARRYERSEVQPRRVEFYRKIQEFGHSPSFSRSAEVFYAA